ncbi:branched-chain amino acid ABC transporter permease [Aquabacter sp. P-9]|uniref:branched-chain amino acid ABC transporter permease n=1 Tax=Aquabacter sediminis TaxID=3029197 RepID=UPI00237E2BC5|nr:branched-chain amino acid ABC transporter permease [Aquabacter sp. P-9]MDE1569026.1 branched-chain amino acid ABC transporter permease [Aquabacter sp. P-9]
MNSVIAVLLLQDGLTTGAIYALLALVLVMVFSVTRVMFVAQGEIVSYGALTLASLQAGHLPGTAFIAVAGGLIAAGMDLWAYARGPRHRGQLLSAALYAGVPLLACGLAALAAPLGGGQLVNVALTLAIVVPLGPILYRTAFQPLAGSSVLVLLIVAVALHFVLTGLGLIAFGAEGVRVTPLVDGTFFLGAFPLSAQSLFAIAITLALICALFAFFGNTLQGKALRATAFNRVGARLVGISATGSGVLAFTLAALIGAVSGILIGSLVTIYYDTGFVIGLKGFVAAILGGLVSYPLAALGAVLVGLLEAGSSFWASAFKDVLVFSLIIPILMWRSLSAVHMEEEEE